LKKHILITQELSTDSVMFIFIKMSVPDLVAFSKK